jgi:hypothetical protein
MAKRRPRFLPVRTRLQRYLFSFGLCVARATIVKKKMDGIFKLAFKAKVASQTWPL